MIKGTQGEERGQPANRAFPVSGDARCHVTRNNPLHSNRMGVTSHNSITGFRSWKI